MAHWIYVGDCEASHIDWVNLDRADTLTPIRDDAGERTGAIHLEIGDYTVCLEGDTAIRVINAMKLSEEDHSLLWTRQDYNQ